MKPWRDVFSSFVERKTRAAIAAATPPYVTECCAPDPTLVAIGNAWSAERFGGPFFVTTPHHSRPACSLVFVRSADGNTVIGDPSKLGGGQTDLHIVYEGLSRVAADAVLAGARGQARGLALGRSQRGGERNDRGGHERCGENSRHVLSPYAIAT